MPEFFGAPIEQTPTLSPSDEKVQAEVVPVAQEPTPVEHLEEAIGGGAAVAEIPQPVQEKNPEPDPVVQPYVHAPVAEVVQNPEPVQAPAIVEEIDEDAILEVKGRLSEDELERLSYAATASRAA